MIHNNFHGSKFEQYYEISGDTLTITSKTDPNIMGIMHAIHLMMQHHNAYGYVYFNWSGMPKKPGAYAYGGGTAFVTADWSEAHHTADWRGEMVLK